MLFLAERTCCIHADSYKAATNRLEVRQCPELWNTGMPYGWPVSGVVAELHSRLGGGVTGR